MRAFPVNEFKLCKFATHLSTLVKMVQSIKAYCATVCEENKLKGFRPTKRGLKFYKAIAGIRKKLRHTVNRAKPMTEEILKKILTVVNLADDKQLAIWTSLVPDFTWYCEKATSLRSKELMMSFITSLEVMSDTLKESW